MIKIAIFDAGSGAYQSISNLGTLATKIWSGTVGGLSGISPAVTVRDLTVVNAGTATIYVGGTSVSATTGVPVVSGGQLTLQGWTATTGSAANDVFAIGAGSPCVVNAGLATVASVV